MNDKEKKDDNIWEIVLGSFLISLNSFNGGLLWEKLLVLAGFVILVVGIVRTMLKCKEQNKKGMTIFLAIMGISTTIIFLGLVYKLLFV